MFKITDASQNYHKKGNQIIVPTIPESTMTYYLNLINSHKPSQIIANPLEWIESNVLLFTDLLTITEVSEYDTKNVSSNLTEENKKQRSTILKSEELDQDSEEMMQLPQIPETIIPKGISFTRF